MDDAPLTRIQAQIPAKVLGVFYDRAGQWRPSRYKVLFGGRGGGKSENVARILIGLARRSKIRILCARMYQNSIQDSVHRTVADAIRTMGIEAEFDIQKATIIHRRTGSDFIFKGIQRDIAGIKSLKGVKFCWIEEAETVPMYEWQILDPTFREAGSEIWITYNPDLESAPTHQMLNLHAPPEAIVQEINWRDNPFFPEVLNNLRLAAKRAADAGDEISRAAYDWIWEGRCRRLTDAVIFRNRVVVEDFDEPPNMRPFYGADWGFADDPTVLTRAYIHQTSLYISHEAFGWHVQMDDIPQFIFEQVPDSKRWPIKGDAAQPMIIDYLRKRRGYNITAAEKWPGSIEDGIAHLQAFTRIVVHPRCKNIAQEFRLYSWKTDPRQLDEKGNPLVLPIVVDKFNHGIDALRYSLDGHIRGRGAMQISPSGMVPPGIMRPPPRMNIRPSGLAGRNR